MRTLSQVISENCCLGFIIQFSTFSGRLVVKVMHQQEEINTDIMDGRSQFLPNDHINDKTLIETIRFLVERRTSLPNSKSDQELNK